MKPRPLDYTTSKLPTGERKPRPVWQQLIITIAGAALIAGLVLGCLCGAPFVLQVLLSALS